MFKIDFSAISGISKYEIDQQIAELKKLESLWQKLFLNNHCKSVKQTREFITQYNQHKDGHKFVMSYHYETIFIT